MSNFGETPLLYYWLTRVREKVEVPATSKLHLMIFRLSGQIEYVLSGEIAHTQT